MLRNLKDAFIVTQKASGAEVIPFIKVWVMLPMALVMTYVFARLKNRLSTEHTFYIILSIFLGYFLIFALLLYPNQEALKLDSLSDYLTGVLPKGCKGLIAMFRYWLFTSFYVMAELWSSIVLSVLFWGFANEITRVTEAKRMYGILGLSANISGIASAQVALMFLNRGLSNSSSDISTQALTEASLMPLIYIVIFVGIVTLLIIRAHHVFVLRKDEYFLQENRPSGFKKKKKMSLRQSFSNLMKSRYVFGLAFIVVAYNTIINLLEVIWKDRVRELYPSASEFAAYMSYVTTWTGIIAIIVALLVTGNALQRLGWTKTALLTPIILLVTCIGFFGFIIFGNNALAMVITLLNLKPLALIVFFGTTQNCFSRAAKYTVFDATKELAFIPLPKEDRFQAKAAIDGVGSRLGKSSGSVIHQGLLLFFGTLIASASYVAVIIMGILAIWIFLVRRLGKEFTHLTQLQSESESQDSLPLKQEEKESTVLQA